ncbi:MAG TPA: bifunctional proline dehydrogenase/L-glutamate gamma-semialdehyde dehydrogenase [Verrucomicrobiae bacterium]|nr:bifunctional proline dehydrogenase/L-glutamate gamma-semialdehyde dehydrogenase [Verrucomicrobiae bacterium]
MHAPNPSLIDEAVRLARHLQERATALQTPQERRQQAELDRMLQTPADKVTLVKLTDQAFRSRTAARTAEHLTHILDVQGVPRFFSPLDRALLRGFQTFGGWLPGVAVPLVKEHMQHETANVVLPAEPELLAGHLAARTREGVRMNVNFLGESLLGEDEATHRLKKYLEALQLPDVEVLSVKISTLYSQISPLAREHTLRVLCDRLELLYREAAHLRYRRSNGSEVPKFVYLDMEEYRDLELTASAFMQTLDRPGLAEVHAGIALQAYIPDSALVQRKLIEWARRRAAAGGAPITVRIVKGANLEMERVEAAHRDWPQAPYEQKVETDANYKRMLWDAMDTPNAGAVYVGVASHNLFDLAYGLVLARHFNALERVQFEMLEGMANHQRRALLERNSNMLLYAPACRKEDFLNAIGYLIRRLDENTGPENFLRHAFKLRVDSEEWKQLEAGFRASFDLPLSNLPKRVQNRSTESLSLPQAEMTLEAFRNEPDTDWALPQNSDWASHIVARSEPSRREIPLVIGGVELTGSARAECRDPSRPGVVVARYRQATIEEIDQAIASAKEDPDGWRTLSVNQRSEILGQAAAEMRWARADLMWAALANGGKTLAESDPEVSEAVDFIEFYRTAARRFFELPDIHPRGRGVIVVVPPWNFPIAIPCGGIAAALAAGNTVILKPASHTVLVAWELCQAFWRAGISKRTLQFVPCPGSTGGQHLVTHSDVDSVVLTGGTETALRMLAVRPELRLLAETGGKNATIVTALADRELAVKHIIHSAFSHSGQKCSATSLLLLEGELYDDEGFKRMLCDAAKSLAVGSAWDLASRVGPLIQPPSGDLETSLKTLEPGESWALLPRPVSDNPNLWSPGIKYGVRAGSYTHNTEFFGPVLGVMRFERLADAIETVNQTGYGLTSGLQSLDEREQGEWKAGIQAGNLYINRGTTGAIVLRQPFGGMGKSAVGTGLKAGGPNYVAQFLHFEERRDGDAPEHPLSHRDLESMRIALRLVIQRTNPQPHIDKLRSAASDVLRALASYDHAWSTEFGRDHDHFHLLGQDNIRRYLPFREIRVRVAPGDSFFDTFARVAAARTTGARVIASHVPGGGSAITRLLDDLTDAWAGGIEFVEESDAQLAESIRYAPAHSLERIRYATRKSVPAEIRQAAAAAGQYIADEPVLAVGRIELLWYLREQSISHDYHRYGNLGARGEENRLPEH